tara:strand:+ start:1146 stop:1316 length:171 start_codon:yes stop_codon:yes gene_type:complete
MTEIRWGFGCVVDTVGTFAVGVFETTEITAGVALVWFGFGWIVGAVGRWAIGIVDA